MDTAGDVVTTEDVNKWLTGDEDENNLNLSNDDIIEDLTTIEEDENNTEVTPSVQKMPHDAEIDSFSASVT